MGSTLLVQPNYIPGNYAVTPQPFPDPAWVIARAYPGYPVYGLYAYLWYYKKFRQDLKDVGWTSFRIAGALTDDEMLMVMEDGVEASVHVTAGTPVTSFPNEEAFLSAAEQETVAALTRYGPGGTFFSLYPQHSAKHIKYVHIWNEPNYHYLIPGATITPQTQLQKATLYGTLLLRLSGVIRTNWPSVQIIGFETGRADPNSSDFIGLVYDLHPGVHDAYDVLATHPGVDPVAPETDNVKTWGSYSIARNTEAIRNVIGTTKPIWHTEAGWKISYSSGGTFQVNPEDTVSPLLQAAYSCRYYATALRLGVDKVTPFFIIDSNSQNGGFFDDATLQWRQCAFAVQTMIATMPRPKLVEVMQDGEDGVFVYRIHPDVEAPSEDPVIMAWNVEGPKTITLALGVNQVEATDMLGTTEITNGTGTYEVMIGPCPIYIKEL